MTASIRPLLTKKRGAAATRQEVFQRAGPRPAIRTKATAARPQRAETETPATPVSKLPVPATKTA